MTVSKILGVPDGRPAPVGRSEEVGTEDAVAAERIAFDRLTRERRGEIYVHCYRMLGALSDAEDMTQETFARAWRARKELASEDAGRNWLYRIATNVCLDAIRRRKRERRLWGDPVPSVAGADIGQPDLSVDWLEPLADLMLSGMPDYRLSPHASYEQAEAVRLAFLACVQVLPARQRAIFLLREVLGWSAAEVAAAFGISPQAANSLLQRARRTFDTAYVREPKWAAATKSDQQVAERYAAALERFDLDGLVALLHSDVALHMPPWRIWFTGPGAIRSLLAQVWQNYSGMRAHVFEANGRTAVAVHVRKLGEDTWRPYNIQVLEVSEDAVVSIVAFVGPLGPALFPKMGLPLEPV